MAGTLAEFPDLKLVPSVDQVGVEERAARFQTRSLKGETKKSALRLAVTMLDVTTLEGADSPGKVQQMCAKARRPLPEDPSIGSGRGGLCVSEPGEGGARGSEGKRGEGGQCRDRLSERADADEGAARGDPTRGVRGSG